MRHLVSVIVLAVVVSIALNGIGMADDKHPPKTSQVTVIGEAPANGPKAKDAAIGDALRNAVMARIGAYVESTTIGKNFETIRDEIIVKANGFATLDSIESTTVKDDILTVKIKATVSNKPLVDRLKELGLTHEWKVGVFMPETYTSKPKPIPDPAAETEIIKALLKSGFRVLDEDERKQLQQDEAARRAVEGDMKALADIKREYGVDVFITGEAFAEYVDESSEGGVTFYHARGRIEAKAYYTDTAEMLSMTDAFADGTDQTENLSAKQCFKALGKKVAGTLVDDISLAPASLTPFITIKIANLKSVSSASTLEDAVRELVGVTQVKRQKFTNGVLEMNVYVKTENRDSLPVDIEKCKVGKKLGVNIDFCSKAFIQGRVTKL